MNYIRYYAELHIVHLAFADSLIRDRLYWTKLGHGQVKLSGKLSASRFVSLETHREFPC